MTTSLPADTDAGELALAKEWARDLLADLDVLGSKYLEAARSHDKLTLLGETPQVLMFALVGRLTSALNEMAPARDNPGLAALSDLHGAMGELCQGNLPDLLQPIPGIGTGREGLRRAFIKKYALLCVEVLQRAGFKLPEAQTIVADKLSRTGHVGRQGGVISKKTIWEWQTRADDVTKKFLERNLQRIEASGGTTSDKAAALAYVEAIIGAPAMRSKVLTSKNPTGPRR